MPRFDELLYAVHARFLQVSTDPATWLLAAIGDPVFQDGRFILLPKISMEVTQECSGVDSAPGPGPWGCWRAGWGAPF